MFEKVRLNNKIYTIVETIETNIVDSFVDRVIKIGIGSGETRLYVSQQKRDNANRFFTFDRTTTIEVESRGRVRSYYPCPSKGVFLKDNLLKYMEDSYLDYKMPRHNFNSDISSLYERNLAEIKNLPEELRFTIHDQQGDDDSYRFYIGSADPIWHNVRRYALPYSSMFLIHKISSDENPNEILYYFEVLRKGSSTPSLLSREKLISNLERDLNNTIIDSTEREAIITARRGQGKFRKNVLSLMPKCPFTEIDNPLLLRASHIKPWVNCSNNHERLDGNNGLTLTPSYDLLFDIGLISFKDDGSLLISSRLNDKIINSLHLSEGFKYNICNLNGAKNQYLEYHRNYRFEP